MGTIVTLSINQLVATNYCLYNTVCGIGTVLGNLLTGTALDPGARRGGRFLLGAIVALSGAACSPFPRREPQGRWTARLTPPLASTPLGTMTVPVSEGRAGRHRRT